MGSAQNRQARKVAARWAFKQALGDWQPVIPQEALEFFLTRQAYVPDTPDLQKLDDARDSVAVFLPKVIEALHKKQGEHYYMNASESQGRVFYFFSPQQPLDAFSLTLSIRNGHAFLAFGYTPYTAQGKLDFHGMVNAQAATEPELAGLSLMRLVRAVLAKIP
jgi:hypothetical protein